MINKYSIFNGAKHFSSGVLWIYLTFYQPTNKLFFLESAKKFIHENLKECRRKYWKSPRSDGTFAPSLINSYRLSDVKFKGDYLINSDISVFRKAINLYISDTLDTWSRDLNTDFTLGYCLFGAVGLTKIADHEKYRYGGYGIGFDACSLFLWTDGS